MLKGNLSTRPFYNERLVTLALAVVAVAAVLLAAFDARRLIELSTRRTNALARLRVNQDEATRIRGHAETLQQAVDRPTLTRLASSTREANELIDRRTFSWTGLFGLLETTLPVDVRIVSISPRLEKGTTHLSIAVVARELADVDGFIDNLMGTGAFYDVTPTEQQQLDDGTYTARLDAAYLARRATSAPPAGPPPSDREKQQ